MNDERRDESVPESSPPLSGEQEEAKRIAEEVAVTGREMAVGPRCMTSHEQHLVCKALLAALNTADCPEASDGYAEHLREAREVEQHQEEEHGE